MPLKFWDEAFLAATYLINRLPNKVINFDTPLDRLFQQKPDYNSLRTFGCACWPNLRPYNSHKLQFRSKQCVFLGFSNLHKGFKCLDVSTGRVYVSRDVTFDEQVFPFATLHPNAGARLRAEIALLPPGLTPSDQGGEEHHDHMFNISIPSTTDISCAGPPEIAATDALGTLDGVPGAHEELSESTQDSAPAAVSGLPTDTPGSLSQGEQERSPARTAVRSQPSHQSGGDTSAGSGVLSPAHGDSIVTSDVTAPGSSTSAAPAQQQIPAEVMRPKTTLQSGIRKEKVYTDGTVRYSCFTSSGSLCEALGDKN